MRRFTAEIAKISTAVGTEQSAGLHRGQSAGDFVGEQAESRRRVLVVVYLIRADKTRAGKEIGEGN
jgi:hypothetical protein